MPIILVTRAMRVRVPHRELKLGMSDIKSSEKLKGDITSDKGFIN